MRRAADAGMGPGRYPLTGSATPTDAAMHSGAGRVRLRMRPMSRAERGLVAPTVSLGDLLSGSGPRVSSSTGTRFGSPNPWPSEAKGGGPKGGGRRRRRDLVAGREPDRLRAIRERADEQPEYDDSDLWVMRADGSGQHRILEAERPLDVLPVASAGDDLGPGGPGG